MEGRDAMTCKSSPHQKTRHVLGTSRRADAAVKSGLCIHRVQSWRQTTRVRGTRESKMISCKEKCWSTLITPKIWLHSFLEQVMTTQTQGYANALRPAGLPREARHRSSWESSEQDQVRIWSPSSGGRRGFTEQLPPQSRGDSVPSLEDSQVISLYPPNVKQQQQQQQ